MAKSEDTLSYVMGKVEQANNDISGKKIQWEAFYKLYRNYREHLELTGRANVGLPIAFEWVEVARARLYKEFCGRRPYIRVRGQEPQDDHPARGIQLFQNWQYDEAKYKRLIYNVLSQVYIFGTGICKYYWRYDEAEKIVHRPVNPEFPQAGTLPVLDKVVVYDNVAFELIDIFDFRVDPEATTIDDARWCAHKTRKTIEFLEDMERQGIYSNISAVKNDMIEDSAGREDDPHKQTRLAIEGHQPDYAGLMKPVELIEYFEDDRIITVANNKHVIRDSKNIYGKKPFIAGKIISTEHEFYGIGLIEAGASIVRLMEDIINNGLDNLNFVINKRRIVNETQIDDAELVDKPGAIIHVTGDVNSALKWDETTDVSRSIFEFYGLMNEVGKRSTGIVDYITGQPTKTTTATEAQLMTAQSSLRIDTHIEVFGDTFVGPLAEAVHELNSYFVTKEKYVRVTGTADNPYELVKITPDIFGANVDFIWEHEGREISQMVQVQQLMQALTLAQQTPALWLVAPLIFARILEYYGLHENDEIMQAVSAAKEMAKLMMLQVAAGSGMTAGGGGLPNVPRLAQGEQNTRQSLQKKSTPLRGSVIQET